MEEQPAVPVQLTAQPIVSPKPASYRRSNGNKFLLVLFGLFILVFVGTAGYLFGYQQGSSQAIRITNSQAEMNTLPTSIQNGEVTTKTKIAKSLTPVLPDRDLQWNEVTTIASGGGLMDIMADKFNQQYSMIPIIQGKYYTATGAATVKLNSYFSTQLGKLGWVLPDAKDPHISFKTFRLRGFTANTCGGVISYVGYKDGKIRMVSVQQAAQTCLPPGQSNNKTTTQQVIYTVFVSDLTPITYFSDYLASHTKK